MAAAGARAAWQRTANRYFVQEDAKRAPGLACCQSSSSSSKQVDNERINTSSDRLDQPPLGFMPSNVGPAFSNLPHDAKWWLHTQPNYNHQRGLNFETADSQIEVNTMSEESLHNVEYEDLGSFIDVKKPTHLKPEEVEFVDNKVDQDSIDLKNITNYYEFLEMEMDGSSISKPDGKFPSSADSSWIGEEKSPWWRVTDGEELASIVSQKSLLHIENCDLPPPQKMHAMGSESLKQAIKSVDYDEIFLSSTDWEAETDAISSPSSGITQRKHWSSMKTGRLTNDSIAAREPVRTNANDTPEKAKVSVTDPCKAKLLEALCHSQTRAREAENAAKEAYTEKEHLLKLFFKQASQLFAYKQWLKLLQLENLLLQNRNSNSSSPLTVTPDLVPWVPHKPRKMRKNKPGKGNRGPQRTDIGKYAVAFAVGFTLVGAGLILGWTVGWLLPAF